jgi:ubiquinone/menaquinone biosynthesis C-methylase UbiE
VQAATAHSLGWPVFGTDLTEALLRQAQGRFPNPYWIAAAAEDLPFPAGSFDAILMLGVIGYVNEPMVVLERLRELLMPKGHLIVSWAHDHTLMESVSRVVSALPDRLYMTVKHKLGDGVTPAPVAKTSFYNSYNRFWSQKAFTKLLAGAGFTLQKTRGVNFGQFRFMDRQLWPERADAIPSAVLERAACVPGLGWLGQFTRTHIALVQRAG